MTKREKDLQRLRNRIARLEKLRDQAIRDLVMTESRLPGLRKQAMRLRDLVLVRELRAQQAKPVDPVALEFSDETVREALKPRPDIIEALKKKEAPVPASASVVSKGMIQNDDGLDVPDYLKRSRQLQTLSDPKTKEKNAERKAVAREVQQAEITGKRRKMPLTGKAAMDALRDSR